MPLFFYSIAGTFIFYYKNNCLLCLPNSFKKIFGLWAEYRVKSEKAICLLQIALDSKKCRSF